MCKDQSCYKISTEEKKFCIPVFLEYPIEQLFIGRAFKVEQYFDLFIQLPLRVYGTMCLSKKNSVYCSFLDINTADIIKSFIENSISFQKLKRNKF